MQSFHVPAYLQLGVPTSWDETRILQYFKDMRLSGTSNENVRILTVYQDDLKMFTEIARSLLRNVELLEKEIYTILSEMLSEVAIDTTQSAEVFVNFTITDDIGNCWVFFHPLLILFEKYQFVWFQQYH